MVSFTKVCLGILYLSTAATSLPTWPQRRDGPIPPSEDVWYQPTPDFESAEPGAILKQREVPYPIAAFNKVPINIQSAHHVMFRSADNFGNPAVAVTTILVPHDVDYEKVLSYQVAEDAATPNCAPSYALQKDHQDTGTSTTQAEFLLMIAALSHGWVVNVPDHEGFEGAFLANNRAGYHTLDSIRAVLSSGSFTNVSSDAKVAMWGYSGGSLASGFAAELQPSYAPELNIVGAALGGTVPTIFPVIDLANKSPNAGLIVGGIVGLSHEYEQVRRVLDEELVPEKRDYFMQATEQCFSDNSEDFKNHDIYSYFKDPDIIYDEELQRIMTENSMGHHTPKIPLLVYKADKDEISAKEDTAQLVKKYCDAGSIVHYHRDGTANHGALAIIGAPDALIWLKDRLEGEENQTECTEHWEWVSILDPEALWVFSKVLLDELKALLGGEV